MNLAPFFRVVVPAVTVTLCACATLDGQGRAARSPVSCPRAALADLDADDSGDKRAHCVGAAHIALRCSVAEATLASYAKELRDLFGRGNAELADIRAGRAGIGCAGAARPVTDLARCCEARGY